MLRNKYKLLGQVILSKAEVWAGILQSPSYLGVSGLQWTSVSVRLLLNVFKSKWKLGKFLRTGRNANVTSIFRKEDLEIYRLVNIILMPGKVVW